MKQIQYKSDFELVLRLFDSTGAEIGWPDYDWEARFYTSMKVNAYIASSIGSVNTNCYKKDGLIHVVFDNHRLSPGKLNVDFRVEIPNGIFPDEYERTVVPAPLDIELIRSSAPPPSRFEVSLVLPYLQPFVDLSEIKKGLTRFGQISLIGDRGEVIVDIPLIPGISSYGYGYDTMSRLGGIGIWDD